MKTAVVLAGGIGFGAYQWGALQALAASGRDPDWLLGSSIGAVNAVLWAGGDPATRLQRLDAFWRESDWTTNSLDPLFAPFEKQSWHFRALMGRFLGSYGRFSPRFPGVLFSRDFPGLYDLGPLRATLSKLVDFPRLRQPGRRTTIACVDVVDGQPLFLDAQRDGVGLEDVMASCGYYPDFPMNVAKGGLRVDGGYYANAPIDPLIDDEELSGEDLTCLVLDLYDPAGYAPRTFLQGLARRNELLFGNQTRRAIDGWAREHRLRAALRARGDEGSPPELTGGPRSVKILWLAYRPSPDAASPLAPFDFSASTLAERKRLGCEHMVAGLAALEKHPESSGGFELIRPAGAD